MLLVVFGEVIIPHLRAVYFLYRKDQHALIGCVPFSTKNIVVPNISGTLLDGGVGVSDHEVKLAYGVNLIALDLLECGSEF